MFWVISVYFNVRNILPKSGTFYPGHPIRCAFVGLNNKLYKMYGTYIRILKLLQRKAIMLSYVLMKHVCGVAKRLKSS